MPTITAETNDGFIYAVGSYNTFLTQRDRLTGSVATSTSTREHSVQQSSRTNRRSFYYFDTSDISVAPSSATIKIKTENNHDVNGDSTLRLILVKSTALTSDSDALATSDYGAIPGFVAGESMAGNVTDYSTTVDDLDNDYTFLEFALTSDAKTDMANNDYICVALIQYEYDYLRTGQPSSGIEVETYYANADDAADRPYLDYVAGSAGDDGDGPYVDTSTYRKYIDLQDMSGSTAPTNKGSVHIMSGTLRTLSGLVISGSSTYAIDIATNSGSIRADEFVTYSDAELKVNVKPVENSLSKIMKLESVSYDKIASGKKEVGFIAQDVAKIIPEVCALDENGEGRGVDYSRLSALIADGIKKQQQKLKAQQEKIVELEEKIEKLKK